MSVLTPRKDQSGSSHQKRSETKEKHTNRSENFVKNMAYLSNLRRAGFIWDGPLEECLHPETRENFRPAKKEIIFRGKVYESVSVLAKAFELIITLYRGGYALTGRSRQALEIKKTKTKFATRKANSNSGASFFFVKIRAQRYGIKWQNIQRRLELGWSPEEAVGLKPRATKRPGNPKAITFLGRKFDSYKQRNEYYGLDENPMNVERRIARGWTPREAVDLDPPPIGIDTWGPSKAAKLARCRSNKGSKVPESNTKGEYRLYKISNSVNLSFTF